MIETVTLKKPINYPNDLRKRVAAFHRMLFDKYWAPFIPLEALSASIQRFTVECPTEEEKRIYAAFIKERDDYHASLAQ